jgi:hypothetical protein
VISEEECMWRRIWRWCVEGAHKQIDVFGIEIEV